MSSKLILSLSFLCLFGCGVKSDPIVPQDTLLPSIESQYMGTDSTKEISNEEEEKKSTSKKENE